MTEQEVEEYRELMLDSNCFWVGQHTEINALCDLALQSLRRGQEPVARLIDVQDADFDNMRTRIVQLYINAEVKTGDDLFAAPAWTPVEEELIGAACEALELIVYGDNIVRHPEDFSLQREVINRLRARMGEPPVVEAGQPFPPRTPR